MSGSRKFFRDAFATDMDELQELGRIAHLHDLQMCRDRRSPGRFVLVCRESRQDVVRGLTPAQVRAYLREHGWSGGR
jgi:hypothetical protein